jgi:hypothetical protein
VVAKFPNSDQAAISKRNAILSSLGLKDDQQTAADVQTLMMQYAKDKDLVPVLGYIIDRMGEGKESQRAMLYQRIIESYLEPPTHGSSVRDAVCK